MRRGRHGVLAIFVMAALMLTACGEDNRGQGAGGATTTAKVLGTVVTQNPGDVKTFCQTSQGIRAAVKVRPIDLDALVTLFQSYVDSAPAEIEAQVSSVVGVFVFRNARPTLGEDFAAIRAFKAKNCAALP